MTNIMNSNITRYKFFIQASRYLASSFSIDAFLNCSTSNRRFSIFKLVNKDRIVNKSSRHFLCSSAKSDLPNDAKESQKKDSVIYCGSLAGNVKALKVFTCISSIGGIIVQPLLVQKLLDGNRFGIVLSMYCFIGFFTFITPMLIHLLTKKYVTEIKFDPAAEIYTATTLSFFCKKKYMDFKLEDVKVPDIPPFFTTMYIKGKPVFIVSDSFLEVEHYIKMMGYDKPIDLKLMSDSDKSIKTQN